MYHPAKSDEIIFKLGNPNIHILLMAKVGKNFKKRRSIFYKCQNLLVKSFDSAKNYEDVDIYACRC